MSTEEAQTSTQYFKELIISCLQLFLGETQGFIVLFSLVG